MPRAAARLSFGRLLSHTPFHHVLSSFLPANPAACCYVLHTTPENETSTHTQAIGLPPPSLLI